MDKPETLPAGFPEPELVELHMDRSGVDITLRHPIIPLIADHLAAAFKDAGGENYVTFEISHPELGPLSLIMQRRWRDTPERKATKYHDALTRIAACETIDEAKQIIRGLQMPSIEVVEANAQGAGVVPAGSKTAQDDRLLDDADAEYDRLLAVARGLAVPRPPEPAGSGQPLVGDFGGGPAQGIDDAKGLDA